MILQIIHSGEVAQIVALRCIGISEELLINKSSAITNQTALLKGLIEEKL